MSSRLYALGRWAYLHHRRVFVLWFVAILVCLAAAAGLGSGLRDSFKIPGTEAQDAIDGLGRTFSQLSGAQAYLVAVAPEGERADSPENQKLVNDTVKEIRGVDGVVSAYSPYSKLIPIGVSEDGRAVQVQAGFDKPLEDVTTEQTDALQATSKQLDDAGWTTAFGGDVFQQTGPQLSYVEAIGLFVALLVLLVTFRSWRAAVMPIVTAIAGVIVVLSLVFAATGALTISTIAPLLAVMIGMAVGMDYSLFIVSRHRELLSSGLPGDEAAARAVATAGSAVVFAGATVVIAMLALAVAGIPFLTVMGVVASAAVLGSVIAATTLLPAMLGWAGDRMRPKDGERPPGSFSRRWVAATTRFPLVAIAIIVVGLAIVAIPGKSLNLALPDNGSAKEGSTQREAFNLVDQSFGPGYNGPLLVAVDVIGSRDPLKVTAEIKKDLSGVKGVETIGLATPNPKGDTAVIQVIPTTGPASPQTADLVHAIRDAAPAWEKRYGVTVDVTGLTAGGVDVSQRLKDALLPFGIIVVSLSVLLLMMVFRSVLVPIKASLGFLLSTGAAFGAVVAVFQWGWLADWVNLDDPGPLVSFLPILLVAMLFGLSMDYEVFLMSRMKEEYIQGDDPQEAIVDGFVGSSRVVTAAAVIMLVVFIAFVPEGDINIRQIAFALAVGVFCDAFLVRMLFAPAVMKLAGKWAWWCPAWLDRLLPHVDVEGEGLHQRVRLSEWPTTGRDHAVIAAGLTSAGREGVVFNDVNVSVPQGDWLVVHGPSGSGKTALLLTLAGRMAFDDGRVRVNGFLLPQEAPDVRHSVALAEFAGINDLDGNLTIDQHIAERLSIRTFGLWVSRGRIVAVRHRINRILEAAYASHGLPFDELRPDQLIGSLDRLPRKVLAVALAQIGEPAVLMIEDVDDLRDPAAIDLFWTAIDLLLADLDVTVVATALSDAASPTPEQTDRTIHHLELNTRHVIDELRI